jgi:hypothetical protein
LLAENKAQIGHRLGMVRIELQTAPVRLDRFVLLSLLKKGPARK